MDKGWSILLECRRENMKTIEAIEAIETMEVIETLTYIERRRHSTIPGDRVIFHGQRLAKDAQINRDIVGILFFLLLL